MKINERFKNKINVIDNQGLKGLIKQKLFPLKI